MSRFSDSGTRRLWQQRFERFERGRLAIAAFCRAEGVSPASFYQWRKKLRRVVARSAAPAAGGSAAGRQAFVPVEVLAASTVEVHLSNGVRLAMPATDRAAIEAVIAAVGRLPRAASEEVEPC